MSFQEHLRHSLNNAGDSFANKDHDKILLEGGTNDLTVAANANVREIKDIW